MQIIKLNLFVNFLHTIRITLFLDYAKEIIPAK